MRLVLFFIVICFGWPALAENELADCAGIESGVERLACYDRLAREKRSEDKEVADAEQPEAVSTPLSKPQREPTGKSTPARSTMVKPSSSVQTTDDSPESGRDNIALFGKEHRLKPAVKTDHIDARIESIRKAPGGEHIMTLSNGQVWMENEPGRRRIQADQDVTIRKHRWHYEMELKSQPNVAVRRVD